MQTVTEVPSFEILHIYCKRVQCKTFLTLQKVHFQLWQMEAAETTSGPLIYLFFLKNDCLYQLLLTSSMDDAEPVFYLMNDNKGLSPSKKM